MMLHELSPIRFGPIEWSDSSIRRGTVLLKRHRNMVYHSAHMPALSHTPGRSVIHNTKSGVDLHHARFGHCPFQVYLARRISLHVGPVPRVERGP